MNDSTPSSGINQKKALIAPAKKDHSPLIGNGGIDQLDQEKAQLGFETMSWANFHNLTIDDAKESARFSAIIALKDKHKTQQELLSFTNDLLKKEDPCGLINLDLLPIILSNYIKMLCASTDAHPIMIICSVIADISAQLATRVYLPKTSGKGDGFYQKLFPNVWFLIVSESGSFKSTALRTGASMVLKKEMEINEKRKELSEELKIATDERRAKIEEEIKALSLSNPVLPTRITSEALLKYLGEGHKGVIITSEFGPWLQNLAKSHNSDLMGILTDLFDVPSTYSNVTKTQGTDILKEPFISIVGVTTLEWLKKDLKIAHIKGGFGARFLIYTPLYEEKSSSMWPKPIDPEVLKAKNIFETALDQIISKINERDREFQPSLSAKKLSDTFHMEIKKTVNKCKSKDLLAPYINRWSPYMLKLAMIMQLFLDPDSEEISDKSLHGAIALILPAIRSTASLLEGEFSETEEERETRAVFDWICKKVMEKQRPISRREVLQSKQVKKGKVKENDEVLRFLVESGKLECVDSSGAELAIKDQKIPTDASFKPLKDTTS